MKVLRIFWFFVCKIHKNNRIKHCNGNTNTHQQNKSFHSLFNKLPRRNKTTNITTNRITSRKTSKTLLNVSEKLLYNQPENGAKIANAIVSNSLNTPNSSLILSLFTGVLKNLLFVVMLTFSFVKQSISQAHETHCDLDFGYYFYCQEKAEEQEKPQNYKEKLETMKQELELKKAKAVMEPNEENVKDYMEYQKKVLDNSSKFADVWRKVLWKNPSLDYTLKHPTNTVAKHKEIDVKRDKIKQALEKLSQRYGLFFVYKSTCPYCHQYSQNLQEFKAIYGVDIVGITLDGIKIEGWEQNTITDLKSLAKIGMQEIKQVPATVLFDNQTKSVLPIGYGILSITELEERIYLLINQNSDENGF